MLVAVKAKIYIKRIYGEYIYPLSLNSRYYSRVMSGIKQIQCIAFSLSCLPMKETYNKQILFCVCSVAKLEW